MSTVIAKLHPPSSGTKSYGSKSSFGLKSGAFRLCPVSTGVSDRIGIVCNCVSMTMFIASPDCDSRAKPTVAV